MEAIARMSQGCDRVGCNDPGTKKCAKCLEAWYCSRECQTASWKVHKKTCCKRPVPASTTEAGPRFQAPESTQASVSSGSGVTLCKHMCSFGGEKQVMGVVASMYVPGVQGERREQQCLQWVADAEPKYCRALQQLDATAVRPLAQYLFGKILRDPNVTVLGRRAEDVEGALRYWRESADAGCALAMVGVGNMLNTQGRPIEALEWWERALDTAQVPEAAYNLGVAYGLGQGVDVDLKRAEAYYKQAASMRLTTSDIGQMIHVVGPNNESQTLFISQARSNLAIVQRDLAEQKMKDTTLSEQKSTNENNINNNINNINNININNDTPHVAAAAAAAVGDDGDDGDDGDETALLGTYLRSEDDDKDVGDGVAGQVPATNPKPLMAKPKNIRKPGDLPLLYPGPPFWMNDPNYLNKVTQQLRVPHHLMDLLVGNYTQQRDMDNRHAHLLHVYAKHKATLVSQGTAEGPKWALVEHVKMFRKAGWDLSFAAAANADHPPCTFTTAYHLMRDCGGLKMVDPMKYKPPKKSIPRHCDHCNRYCFNECECGEAFCDRDCQAAAWKDHRHICETVKDNNELAFTITKMFWGDRVVK